MRCDMIILKIFKACSKMSLISKRSFASSIRVLGDIKSPFKTNVDHRDRSSFEKNIPTKKPLKAWEKSGEVKDEYFKKRFAHVHSKSVNNDSVERRQKYKDIRDSRKKESYTEERNERYQHRRKFESRDVYRSLKPNPLSEFIYGTSPVLAALTSNKREFFNRLLIHNPEGKDKEIFKLATKLGIKTVVVDSKNELNVLTNNGIHNGYVLETKPLTPTPVFQLGSFDGQDYMIEEDNFGDVLEQPYQTKNTNPLGIYIDGVTDPHNIGAIIRSAYFLGADFIVMSEKNSAPLSPVVTKTSVGATEFLNIMAASKPLKFFEKSKENGWTFISAGSVAEHHRDSKIQQSLQSKVVNINDLNALLENGPCVLVLGSEGEGIRTTLKLRSDYIVEIGTGQGVNPIIDSLNVSVAGALLIQKALHG